MLANKFLAQRQVDANDAVERSAEDGSAEARRVALAHERAAVREQLHGIRQRMAELDAEQRRMSPIRYELLLSDEEDKGPDEGQQGAGKGRMQDR